MVNCFNIRDNLFPCNTESVNYLNRGYIRESINCNLFEGVNTGGEKIGVETKLLYICSSRSSTTIIQNEMYKSVTIEPRDLIFLLLIFNYYNKLSNTIFSNIQ